MILIRRRHVAIVSLDAVGEGGITVHLRTENIECLGIRGLQGSRERLMLYWCLCPAVPYDNRIELVNSCGVHVHVDWPVHKL